MYLSKIINKNEYNDSLNKAKKKYETLPLYSLRVEATTHSIVHVLKNELNLENVDDVINMLADNYIENSNEKTEILEEIQAENEYKLRNLRKEKRIKNNQPSDTTCNQSVTIKKIKSIPMISGKDLMVSR